MFVNRGDCIIVIIKYLLFLAGSLSLVLGVLGIFLPVLPTTPFLLLASYCYLRSSRKMYNWVINHKILGPYIQSYLIYKAITLKTKIRAILFLWLTLCMSIILISSLHVRIFLFFIGVAVTIYLVTLKTISYEEMQKLNEL